MDDSQLKLLADLEQLESVGERILADQEKSKMLEVNKRKTQEAINRLRDPGAPSQPWTCLSGQFFRLPNQGLQKALRSDLAAFDSETEVVRKELKENLELLHTLEGKRPLSGFNLKPLAEDELAAVSGFKG